MECRKHCGACCIAPSISSTIPGMPEGKPAGVPCVHLTEDFLCELFHSPLRPDVCKNFTPEKAICGNEREEAMNILRILEEAAGNS
ncbi:MAG: YkgJ family cysteine cluster protein [Bacteroidales bacterium]|nr:YkgJ family cysteine cluster protein [Bacteroidales bacterium]